jgi:hypothetical protein
MKTRILTNEKEALDAYIKDTWNFPLDYLLKRVEEEIGAWSVNFCFYTNSLCEFFLKVIEARLNNGK